VQRVNTAIRALSENPHPPDSKKLQGEDHLYRIRIGDYRVLYMVQDERLIVLVVDVGHRRDIYRTI